MRSNRHHSYLYIYEFHWWLSGKIVNCVIIKKYDYTFWNIKKFFSSRKRFLLTWTFWNHFTSKKKRIKEWKEIFSRVVRFESLNLVHHILPMTKADPLCMLVVFCVLCAFFYLSSYIFSVCHLFGWHLFVFVAPFHAIPINEGYCLGTCFR